MAIWAFYALDSGLRELAQLYLWKEWVQSPTIADLLVRISTWINGLLIYDYCDVLPLEISTIMEWKTLTVVALTGIQKPLEIPESQFINFPDWDGLHRIITALASRKQ